MAAQLIPQSQPQYPQRIGEQDCRDYLRTGRCKYGESCKYNHPPNVQSGGGIRAPVDPNEPPFPIRPNEPPCQYYLKHGTCKFGQTCKFHHPSHILATGGGSLSGTVLMNVVSSHGSSGQQQQFIALNDGGGVGELQQVVQLLPQRPGEPDCIYFLRNGRCKYGATCKYHHPLTNTQSQQQRHQDQTYVQRVARDRSTSAGSTAERNGVMSMQYVSPHSGAHSGAHGNYGQRHGEPTHLLVSDGSIRVMTISSQTPGRQSSYQQQVSNANSPVVTSSSVASSYETAASSLEYVAASSQGQFHHHQDDVAVDSSGRIWRRTTSQEHLSSLSGHRPPSQEHLSSMAGRRPPSQEHLSSLAGRRTSSQERLPSMPGPQGQGSGAVGSSQGYEHSTISRHSSHGSISGSRIGLESSGSNDNDGGAQHHPVSSLRRAAEASQMVGQQQHQYQDAMYGGMTYASTANVDVGRKWSTSTSHSNRGGYAQEYNVPRVPSGSYLSSNAPEFVMEEDHRERYTEDAPNTANRAEKGGHRDARHAQEHAGNANEEGLSMMTSALLNMLDTTDHDAGGRDADDTKTSPTAARKSSPQYSRHQLSTSAPGTPLQKGASAPRSPQGFDEGRRVDIGSSALPNDVSPRYRIRYQGSLSMPTHQEDFVPSFSSPSHDQEDGPPASGGRDGSDPGWSPTWHHSHSQELEHNAQSVSVLQSANNAQPPSHGGGFYLP